MSDERIRNMLKGLAATVLLLQASALLAQEQGHLNVKTVVQKQQVRVDEAGKEQTELVDADKVVPGDHVIYTITFQNIGDEPAAHVVITNPVDANLTYIAGSAFGPGMDMQFSVDGGKTFASLDALTVSEDGTERPAEPKDVTHIRWVMHEDLAAGAQGIARFAAVLK
jgi:uncharacterized repeat protein (TIGR01451 family)